MSTPDLLLWLRAHSTLWLDTVMGVTTYLGSDYFYLAALSFLYWCVDSLGTMRLFVLFLSSFYLGDAVKEITRLPRPFQVHPEIEPRFAETAEGFAFPSGHALQATVFWGWLAISFRKRWLYIAAPILALLIGFSRLYLGLHWPRDVLAGLVIGLAILGFAYVLMRVLASMPIRAHFPATLVFCLLPLLLFLLFPSHGGAQSMGALFGAILGQLLERQYIHFRVRGPAWQQLLKALIGLAGAFLLFFGLRALFDPLLPSREVIQVTPGTPAPAFRGFLYGRGYESLTFVRYALVGLWATLVAPALFRLFFGREEESGAAV